VPPHSPIQYINFIVYFGFIFVGSSTKGGHEWLAERGVKKRGFSTGSYGRHALSCLVTQNTEGGR
jgi:hypothetical protein